MRGWYIYGTSLYILTDSLFVPATRPCCRGRGPSKGMILQGMQGKIVTTQLPR